MKNKVYNYLIENYCYEELCFKDVRFEERNGPFKTFYKEYELIVFNLKKILFVTRLNEKISNTDAALQLRTSLNFIANKLSLSLNDFLVCGITDEKIYLFNTYNGKVFSFLGNDDGFNDFAQFVENEFTFNSYLFECSKLKALSDELNFSSSTRSSEKTKNKVKVSSEGVTCIFKHGRWYEASEYDTMKVFMLAVFGGMFGAHLFCLKKKTKALLYLLSFGGIGIGWLFDSLEIIFGIYKDREGKYLLPLENKMLGLIMLLAGGVVFCLSGFFVIIFIKLISQGFSSILNSLIESFKV